jgi:hypothetical protein
VVTRCEEEFGAARTAAPLPRRGIAPAPRSGRGREFIGATSGAAEEASRGRGYASVRGPTQGCVVSGNTALQIASKSLCRQASNSSSVVMTGMVSDCTNSGRE